MSINRLTVVGNQDDIRPVRAVVIARVTASRDVTAQHGHRLSLSGVTWEWAESVALATM
ncbi:hypothetical protein ACQP1G_00880 [Nocardia sp. CA-107356]|uniref:hypothetical protein n=1 Tax=Nocardia sp. CA-107356 TaxID=3239972 RepID=UPI003D8B6620